MGRELGGELRFLGIVLVVIICFKYFIKFVRIFYFFSFMVFIMRFRVFLRGWFIENEMR